MGDLQIRSCFFATDSEGKMESALDTFVLAKLFEAVEDLEEAEWHYEHTLRILWAMPEATYPDQDAVLDRLRVLREKMDARNPSRGKK